MDYGIIAVITPGMIERVIIGVILRSVGRGM